jgi:hypothetical protein
VLLRRAILLFAVAALFSAPVSAWAHAAGKGHQGESDGTLAIQRGKGLVDLKAQGAVIGRVAKGKVKVKIYKGKHKRSNHGQVSIRLKGKGTIRHKADGTIVYTGKNIRIKIVDQKFRVQINGVGIHLSVVAEGTCGLQAAQNGGDPGVFSLNGAAYQPLPKALTTYQLSPS